MSICLATDNRKDWGLLVGVHRDLKRYRLPRAVPFVHVALPRPVSQLKVHRLDPVAQRLLLRRLKRRRIEVEHPQRQPRRERVPDGRLVRAPDNPSIDLQFTDVHTVDPTGNVGAGRG